MRIAFLDSWWQETCEGSGTAVAIGGLAEALIARGHRVERIVPLPGGPRSMLLRRLWFNLTLRRRFAELAAGSLPYDLCVGFDIDGVRIAHRCPVPYVCSIKGVLAEEQRCERGWPWLLLGALASLERLHARRAPLVLATSHYCSERIQARYGVGADRLRLVPEGIDLASWRGDPGADEEMDRRRDPHTVLCVARQYPRKRVDDLIRAFALLSRRLPAARLVIVGDGPRHGALRRLVDGLGLHESVRLLGALASHEEVRTWYARSSLFCLPSIQEGFGIVFLEAMASGLPVVSTTAAAIPEVVPHGRAGLLVPPRDPPALADALQELLSDPPRLARFRAFGRDHVLRYGWDRVAERFLQAVAPPSVDSAPR